MCCERVHMCASDCAYKTIIKQDYLIKNCLVNYVYLYTTKVLEFPAVRWLQIGAAFSISQD